MKIELTDKQLYDILENMPLGILYTYLAKNRSKGFKLIKNLLYDAYNTESYINAFKSIIEEIPIQKELF